MEITTQTSIKASELRIGNWVQSNIYQQVTLEILDWLLNKRMDHTALKPIPLSPEILEKCGFSYLGNGSYENGHMFDKIFVYKRNTLSIGIMLMAGGKLSISFNTNFKTNASMRIYEGSEYYLHQLQNLYQALTGEELEVNL